jgi:rhamnulokinase
MFDRMAGHRDRLYALTGIQHQPFNTIYQLAARDADLPSLHGKPWLLMPDLMGYLLTGVAHCEYTMASTTQLMGLDDDWSSEAFEMIGWPIPDVQISRPGQVLSGGKVSLVSVGSHDTASAVFGLGPLQDDQAFLNVGTWSLLGTIVDHPLLTATSFTNERTVDGRVRYLANIPGFYVVNRVHEELAVSQSIPDWLQTATFPEEHRLANLMSQEFFNPNSMCDALAKDGRPNTHAEWAGLALGSLVETTASQLQELAELTGRFFSELRVAGGGSRSSVFCQALASRTGIRVFAGPEEATLLGNLAVQFLASGDFGSFEEASAWVGRSFEIRRYDP